MVLPLIEDMNFVEELIDDLRNLFKADKGFDSHMFERQMGVMHGQILNLRKALRDDLTPLQLVQMTPIIIKRYWTEWMGYLLGFMTTIRYPRRNYVLNKSISNTTTQYLDINNMNDES